MIKLKYVGLKTDGERAFMQETGIEWMPGAVHEVEQKVAGQMLAHPTIWQRADGGAPLAAAKVKPPVIAAADDQDVDDAATQAEVKPKKAKK